MNATDIQQIDELFQKRLAGFPTKNDLRNFATKQDLERLVTKDDLKNELARFATKDDLLAFKKEFKDDLSKLKKELMEYIAEGEVAIIDGVEKHVVSKTAFQTLEDRVEKVEHQLQQT